MRAVSPSPVWDSNEAPCLTFVSACVARTQRRRLPGLGACPLSAATRHKRAIKVLRFLK